VKLRRLTPLLCSWVAVGWWTTQKANPIGAPIAPTLDCTAASPNVVGRVLSVENDDRIEAGQLLCAEDTLQPASNANVVLLCYDTADPQRLPPGIPSTVKQLCSQEIRLAAFCPDVKEPCLLNDGRSGNGKRNTPTIIRPPQGTALSTQTPTLSWYAVAGATHYNVSISDAAESETIRETKIEGSDEEIRTIDFNDLAATPLTWGTGYQLEVTAIAANGENASKTEISSFSILEEAEAQQVNQIIAQLDRLNIPEEDKVLLDLWHIYNSKNLKADAIERLDRLAQAGSQNPKVYRLLGEIYLRLTLLDLAGPHLDRAKQLAMEAGDSEELEEAQYRLDEISRYRESQDGLLRQFGN
jgi:hypothetical protein